MNQQNSNLPAALALLRKESLLKQAVMVRDWEDGPQRAEQAKILIRQTLVEWATGRICQETESKLYAILDFAMPGQCDNETEKYATAFQQQLSQQYCAECGDGICPGGD